MTRRNRAKSSSLFLMELILAILFFSIASAVCVQFFVKSHLLSQRAQELNYAVSECSSVAEIIDTSDNLQDVLITLTEVYPDCDGMSNSNQDSASIFIYYDENFGVCEKSAATYQLVCEMTTENNMLTGEMYVSELAAVATEDATENTMEDTTENATEDATETTTDDSENDVIYTLTVKHYMP